MRLATAPGKTMLAGEYAVLLPGEPCLVAAVERRVTVEVTPADVWSVDTGSVRWREGEPPTDDTLFVRAAIDRVSAGFAVKPSALRTSDDMHIGGHKLGLGGSAAATVATVFGVAPPRTPSDLLWSIADEVHRTAQGGRGSGADVAASVHGGVIRYTREPRLAEPVAVHPDVRLLVVWSGASAVTSGRLVTWAEFVSTREEQARLFARLSREAVASVEQGLVTGDLKTLRGGIGAARAALHGLEAAMGLEMETPALKMAADEAWRLGACGKLSGAGGGDCAIVLTVGDDQAQAVKERLAGLGLRVLAVPWARMGVRVEDPVG